MKNYYGSLAIKVALSSNQKSFYYIRLSNNNRKDSRVRKWRGIQQTN